MTRRSLRLPTLLALLVPAAVAGFLACSSSDDGGSTSGGNEAGTDAPRGTDASQAPDSAIADAAPEAAVDAAPVTCQESADAGAPPEMIASGLTFPSGVAVDDTSVYFTTQTATGGVFKCPLTGCGANPPSVIASNQAAPYSIHVDKTGVYWVNQASSIQRCPLAGCGASPPMVYAAGLTKAIGLTTDAVNLYWTNNQLGTITSCPLAGCVTPTVIYAGPTGVVYGLAVDGTSIYWLNQATLGVYKAPLTGVPDGGSPIRLAQASSLPAFLDIDDANLYWTEYSNPGNVGRTPLTGEPDGGAGAVLAAGLLHPNGIIVDRVCGTVYWASSAAGVPADDAGVPAGAVQRCSKSGCGGTPTVFAGGQKGPTFVTQDNAYVYWSNRDDGTVWRKHK